MPHVNPIQIQKFLKGVDYPASKDTLIKNAKNMGADENVCASLEQLPDEDFQTPADVSQAFGKLSDEPDRASSSTGSDEFLAQALQDSLAEVQLCEMALEKTSNDEVKKFAQRMIDEHGKMGREIEQLASRKKLSLPKDVSPDDRRTMDKMSKLSGAEFDRKFIAHNVEDHEKDIKVFRHYAEQEKDSDLKAFASKGEKTLTQHLEMAKKTGDSLKS